MGAAGGRAILGSMATTLALPIELPEREIAEFCERNAITKMWLFGSVLRDDFTDESDVLVQFEPGKTPGLAFFGLPDDLEAIFGRRVDVVSAGGLRGPIGQRIRETAVPVYVRD
jgi:predicted nucleotidyltransferase